MLLSEYFVHYFMFKYYVLIQDRTERLIRRHGKKDNMWLCFKRPENI